jgi:putative transposon-encoded protein
MTRRNVEIRINDKLFVKPEQVIKGKVTKIGTGAKIGVPRKHIGKKAYVIIAGDEYTVSDNIEIDERTDEDVTENYGA